VEAIGLRSTRIRGVDRTLTTIPNAALAKMAIENFAERDRILIQTIIGVRYETSLEQLRFLLAKIRELLLTHPRIHKETARARLVGFGASSLDIELFAFATTRDRIEFLSIREDLLLRVMELVEQSGTALAYPSQTLYFSKDRGLDPVKSVKAEAQVSQWRQEGHAALSSFLQETPVPAPEGSAEKA
jgi:MscS family membrane protein